MNQPTREPVELVRPAFIKRLRSLNDFQPDEDRLTPEDLERTLREHLTRLSREKKDVSR